MRNSIEQIKIDKSVIVQTALQFLQEHGIRKLSMRNIAERLEIKGASLYWHIRNKNELLELIADEICKKIKYPDESLSCEEQLAVLTRQLREILLNVRDSAHVLVETPPTTPYRINLIKKISGLFEKMGMKSEDIFSASWILNNYVTSFVIEEYRLNDVTDEKEVSQSLEALPFNISSMDMDREYQFGLEVLIEGFKSKLK
ncbi:TetR/AcrR family transcriptional regulator C-terminal domain-containing protein [Paenibacillus sp. J2TS4]|uniref:TetR/AcrR family transcriptional regulator C-terminal domain-containing protein n=1 Tax=Paenibacillus sp. J2TS4 TaxID=2807194 RepID=UPI001B2A57B0|nr:TetR/AcrR family transcriptional regulator C-terminal domain-containing protein [Paenibacillus sp. J2TS4]GIP36101.1 TetR family transcriptional regulator [Paenibacillus sp. J2TS4]